MITFAEGIDVIGLSETKLKQISSKFIFKNNPHYNAYFEIDTSSSNGSGVGIVIANLPATSTGLKDY